MKFAYFGHPHTGGTYTVFQNLRQGLASKGIEVRWVGIGQAAQAAIQRPEWVNELEAGEVVTSQTKDDRELAYLLGQHLVLANYDGVFVNVLANRLATNAVRFLDSSLLRIMIVHNITVATYAAAKALRHHVHATVGVSPRIAKDLVKYHGFASSCTLAIPNAVDLVPYETLVRSFHTEGQPLRLLSLGRVEDASKGVLWLPKILSCLKSESWKMTIAGDGPDLSTLKERCSIFGDRVNFLGAVPKSATPDLFANHDVFLFPSRFEGFGQTLVEAMAGGCVPVASRIRQVTDCIVTDEETGLLFDIGDVNAATKAIKRLMTDHAFLHHLASRAQCRSQDYFSLPTMAEAYKSLLTAVQANPSKISDSLPFEVWAYPPELNSGLRRYLPPAVKKVLRILREKVAIPSLPRDL